MPRWNQASPEVRFMRFVVKDPDTDCWLWIAETKFTKGYGKFRVGVGNIMRAHRFAYEHFVGPIPDGMEIDHTCHVRNCVNPAHLEAVTHLVNVQRGSRATATHCKRGHEFTPENTYMQVQGKYRMCLECQRQRRPNYKRRTAATA